MLQFIMNIDAEKQYPTNSVSGVILMLIAQIAVIRLLTDR